MRKLLSLFLLLSTLCFSQQIDLRTAKLYKDDITAIEAYTMQQQGVLLIDIRTKREYRKLHPKDAINIPLFFEKKGQRVYNKNFLQNIYDTVNKDLNKKIVLICRSGSRTILGSNLLAHNGFTNVYNVKYGFQFDWIKIKLPTEK